MTQLTLQLDDDLVLQAKEYSTRTGKSLSDLVADFLASLRPERAGSAGEAALLSEAALAQDWLREEEEEAWRHFQPDV